jgi:alpha-glucuronidase
MPRTQVMPELQITQEYLGFSNHFVFLATMWREFLDSDTFARGAGSTVTKVMDGTLYHQRLTAIAGVANTGTAQNWTGHDLSQANWYAFGRLAWNPHISPEQIATEWTKMTLTHDASAVATIVRLMLGSHEAVVNYMTPLGLHHLFWGGHHYGPAPWWDTEKREDWNPVYYHKADAFGIGFDRTKSGSNTVSQYHLPVRRQFSDVERCPEKFLLWFHHVSWDHRMKSGRTLWDEMALHYQRGVDWVRSTRAAWESWTMRSIRSGTRQLRRSWKSRSVMQSGGVMRVCFTFRRLRSDRCRVESNMQRNRWQNTKQRLLNGKQT